MDRKAQPDVLATTARGDHHNGNLGELTVPLSPCEELGAGHDGHHQVEQDDTRFAVRVTAQPFQGFQAVRGAMDSKTFVLENDYERITYRLIIVNDEYPSGGGHHQKFTVLAGRPHRRRPGDSVLV